MAVKIMLDAGHYGKQNLSPCDTNPKYYESDMTWKLHLYLKSELEQYGFTVGTTRSDKCKDLEVYQRGQKSKGYDLFLSLHSNAAGSYVASGVDRPVIIYPVKGTDEQRLFAGLIGSTIRDVMQTKQSYQIYTREYPNRPDQDYYGVIRGAVAAGCNMAFILEHGFHTDPSCTKWLLDDDNLKRMAVVEAQTISNYYKNLGSLVTGKDRLYTVQVGCFSVKQNAENMLNRLKSAGFTGYIKEV